MKHYAIKSQMTQKEFEHLIEQGEERFEQQLSDLARTLSEIEDLRLIGLTGPTCSGKTTAAEKLTDALERFGKSLHVISIDDFYFDKAYLTELASKKGRTEPDYDSEDTIDISFLRDCTDSLLEGRETHLPHFNFHSGQREEGIVITPKPNDLFLFEGIQILYPKVEQILCGRAYQSVYISPESSIQVGGETFAPNEIRLMRRLVRDAQFRSTSPAFTLFLWQSVRENEEKNIFPYAHHCNHHVDSTMPYEVGVLKPYLEKILPTVPSEHSCSKAAEKILARVRSVQPLPSDLIPSNSLYKEFI